MLIETISTLIYNKIHSINEVPKYDYFKQYVSCIDISDTEILKFINDEHSKIDKEFIRDAAVFASIDVPRGTPINNDAFTSYIIYLIIMSIYHHKYVKEYRINNSTLILEGKSRPDTLVGIILLENQQEINIRCKPVNKYGYNKKLKIIIDKMVKNSVPIPYYIEINNFIILEKCDHINASNDYLAEVYKDLINQFKNINKYYWVSFFTHNDIGKSRHIKGRYFLYNFDSLVTKKNNSKYSYKLQINRIVEILRCIYGDNQYTSTFTDFLESEEDKQSIFDNCILFLMQLKM